MTITCPHCGFSRETSPERIPAGRSRVVCPRCRQRFPLPPVETPRPPASPPAAPASPAAASPPAAIPSAAELPKGGFWIRLMAWLIDSFAVSAVQAVLGYLLLAATGMLRSGLSEQGALLVGLVLWLFGAVVGMAYYVFFTGYCGQTPGKMAVEVKVIRTDGGEIGYGRAFLREVPGKFLSALILGIGFLMIAFDAQKQGLHDKIADTYVIKV